MFFYFRSLPTRPRRFVGFIDEVMIYVGVALWTQDFTPPTASDYGVDISFDLQADTERKVSRDFSLQADTERVIFEPFDLQADTERKVLNVARNYFLVHYNGKDVELPIRNHESVDYLAFAVRLNDKTWFNKLVAYDDPLASQIFLRYGGANWALSLDKTEQIPTPQISKRALSINLTINYIDSGSSAEDFTPFAWTYAVSGVSELYLPPSITSQDYFNTENAIQFTDISGEPINLFAYEDDVFARKYYDPDRLSIGILEELLSEELKTRLGWEKGRYSDGGIRINMTLHAIFDLTVETIKAVFYDVPIEGDPYYIISTENGYVMYEDTTLDDDSWGRVIEVVGANYTYHHAHCQYNFDRKPESVTFHYFYRGDLEPIEDWGFESSDFDWPSLVNADNVAITKYFPREN